jgi:hypothetical protein
MDARLSGIREPRSLSGELPESSFTHASSKVIVVAGLVPESTSISASAPVSASASSTSPPAGQNTHAHTVSASRKEELFGASAE